MFPPDGHLTPGGTGRSGDPPPSGSLSGGTHPLPLTSIGADRGSLEGQRRSPARHSGPHESVEPDPSKFSLSGVDGTATSSPLRWLAAARHLRVALHARPWIGRAAHPAGPRTHAVRRLLRRLPRRSDTATPMPRRPPCYPSSTDVTRSRSAAGPSPGGPPAMLRHERSLTSHPTGAHPSHDNRTSRYGVGVLPPDRPDIPAVADTAGAGPA